jgi:transcriptional regulator with XRE-family HTH domain
MTVGEKILKLRTDKGLTQEELAEKIGAAKSAISFWELDKFYPNLFSCICLADYFGISLDELACRDFKGANK